MPILVAPKSQLLDAKFDEAIDDFIPVFNPELHTTISCRITDPAAVSSA